MLIEAVIILALKIEFAGDGPVIMGTGDIEVDMGVCRIVAKGTDLFVFRLFAIVGGKGGGGHEGHDGQSGDQGRTDHLAGLSSDGHHTRSLPRQNHLEGKEPWRSLRTPRLGCHLVCLSRGWVDTPLACDLGQGLEVICRTLEAIKSQGR